MAGNNQHYCVRWEYHQSTFISVFNTLLESGSLVDCTLAAEGQYIKAHKVILSACSPYLGLLFSQHSEMHPIVILKDIKYQELKSMIDYMYKGEVNISKDQLSTFLKAAESLQIKGLTDLYGSEDGAASSAPINNALMVTSVSKPVQQTISRGPSDATQGLTTEKSPESSHIRSRDDNTSPTPRKRRHNQRWTSTSDEPDCHTNTNSRDVPPQSIALSSIGISNIPAATIKDEPLDSDCETDTPRKRRHNQRWTSTSDEPDCHTYTNSRDVPPQSIALSSIGISNIPATTIKDEPLDSDCETDNIHVNNHEYIEEMNNEDSKDDLTFDYGDDMNYNIDMYKAGPSHGYPNQSFGQWLISENQITDEVFMNTQEAVGTHKDTQEYSYKGTETRFECPRHCGKMYRLQKMLAEHLKYECDSKVKCPYCSKMCKKSNLTTHIESKHDDLINL